MNPSPESDCGAPRKKPRLALLLATAFGLGYLPKAPGTWGSLGGVALAICPGLVFTGLLLTTEKGFVGVDVSVVGVPVDALLFWQCLLAIGVVFLGVVTAGITAEYISEKDPQKVVIDEVSGQQLTLLLGGFWPGLAVGHGTIAHTHPLATLSTNSWPNWKYLLAGFILFRVFDIWKPFPVRQAETLPGGWGIMADDWVAAIYAALGLWLARAFGL